MTVNKAQNPLPGISRSFGILLCSAIKQAVGGTGKDNNVMLNARLGQLLLEALHVADRNARIIAAKEAECRIVNLLGKIEQRASPTKVPAHTGVKADDACQIEIGCAGNK